MAIELHTTPRGVAVFPRLSQPDTKFKEEGEYSVKLRLTEDNASELIELIDRKMAESMEEAKKEHPNKKKIKVADTPYKEDEENPGYLIFNFKMKASGIDRKTKKAWSQRPSIYDSKGRAISDADLKIGSGSELKVSFHFNLFFTDLIGAGVSLRLKGVQLLKLVEWGQRSAESLGFQAEEDGFEYEEESPAQDLATPESVTVPEDGAEIPDF